MCARVCMQVCVCMLAHACTRQLKDRPELRAQSAPLLRRNLKLLTSSNLSHGAPHPQPSPPLQRAGSHTQSPNLPTSMNAVWPSAPQAPRKAMWSAGFPSITLEEDQGAEACRTWAAPRQEAAVDRVQGRGKPGKPGPAHPRSLDKHRLDFGPAFLKREETAGGMSPTEGRGQGIWCRESLEHRPQAKWVVSSCSDGRRRRGAFQRQTDRGRGAAQGLGNHTRLRVGQRSPRDGWGPTQTTACFSLDRFPLAAPPVRAGRGQSLPSEPRATSTGPAHGETGGRVLSGTMPHLRALSREALASTTRSACQLQCP